MGFLFDQIRLRQAKDEQARVQAYHELGETVEDSTFHANKDGDLLSRRAVEQLYAWFHLPLPDDAFYEDPDRLLRALPHRRVTLQEGWQTDSAQPLLVYAPNDRPMLLFPGPRGCWYREGNRRRRLTRDAACEIRPGAVAFCRPIPDTVTDTRGFCRFALGCLDVRDCLPLCVAAVALTLLGAMTPWMTRSLLAGAAKPALIAAALALGFAALGQAAFTAIRSFLSARVSAMLSLSLESSLMDRLIHLPIHFLREHEPSELTGIVTNARNMGSSFVEILFSNVLSALLSLAYFAQVAAYAPELLLAAGTVAAGMLLLAILFARQNIRYTQDQTRAFAAENSISFSLLHGVMKLRLAGAEDRAFAKWASRHAKSTRLAYCQPALRPIITAVVPMIATLVFFLLGWRASLAPADFAGFSAAFGLVMASLVEMQNAALCVGFLVGGVRMLAPILQTPNESAQRETVPVHLQGGISLSHLTFRYDEGMPPVIDDLSLVIQPRQFLGIVGESGSGKSTLLRLLLDLEKPECGTVCFDRYDISFVDPNALRGQMGVVMQNDALLSGGSIFDNLSISHPNMTEDEAWEALRLADMEKEVRAMPMKLNTIVSERGGFSGGQKQRLLIARAIAPRPKILVMDEATSALDNLAQKRVSDALAALECTRVVVAHRLSTIVHCDRIVVLAHGRIVEDGNYQQLMDKGGVFTELVRLQSG